MLFFIFVWLFFATCTAIAASNRGCIGILWLIWGLFFGIFALIIVLLLPNKARWT